MAGLMTMMYCQYMDAAYDRELTTICDTADSPVEHEDGQKEHFDDDYTHVAYSGRFGAQSSNRLIHESHDETLPPVHGDVLTPPPEYFFI